MNQEKNESKRRNSIFVSVSVVWYAFFFFNFFGMSLEKNVHHTLVLTLVKCQCSLIRALKKNRYYLVVIIG